MSVYLEDLFIVLGVFAILDAVVDATGEMSTVGFQRSFRVDVVPVFLTSFEYRLHFKK